MVWLINTIAHGERTAYGAGNALEAYIRGERQVLL